MPDPENKSEETTPKPGQSPTNESGNLSDEELQKRFSKVFDKGYGEGARKVRSSLFAELSKVFGTEITTAGFAEGARSEGALAGDGVKIMIRPEQIAINPGEEIKNRLRGTITERQFLGSFLVYYIQSAESELIVKIPGISRSKLSLQPAVGDEVTIGFRPEDCTIV